LEKPLLSNQYQRNNQTYFIIVLLLNMLNALLLVPAKSEELAPPVEPINHQATEGSPTQTPPLPTLPAIPPAEQTLSSIAHILVKRFQFEGNQVFSTSELSQLLESYQNRELSAEQLQEAKNIITQHYINHKFINSGAIIPDQQVVDGVITIKIIEGKLSEVEVSGNKRVRTPYIQKRLEDQPGVPLNLDTLQERLQMLQQNSLFERINAELGPGLSLGEGILRIEIEESRPYHLQFNFNNHRSPSVGAYRGELVGWHHNVTGWGDTFYARYGYGFQQGLKDYNFRYDLPINHYGTVITLNMEHSDAKVVEKPFDQIDIESEADTYALSLTQPLWQKPNKSLLLGLKLEKRQSETSLLDQPFRFQDGGRDGKSKLSVIRFSQDWLDRSRTEVIAARSSFNFGIDAFNATIDNSPDSQFFSWLGQFQYVRRLDFLPNPLLQASQIIFRIDLQKANQGLLSLEKFSVGGATTVRGYRENQMTRDNGLISSLEWRLPLPFLQWRWSKLSKNPEDGIPQIATFFDYGRAWNESSEIPDDPKDIYSIGLGLRWSPSPHINTELYWGHALRDIPDPADEDLQDDGVHFELSLLF
jgi:hemolysin activation/secretion protein